MEAKESKNNPDTKLEELSPKLKKYIDSVVKKEGYISYDVETINLSSKGGSYMGILYEINIKGTTEDGDKKTNIFMKHILNPLVTLIYRVPDVYKREKFVYTDIIKEMYDFQEKYNVPQGDRYIIAKAFDECNEETIILENLVKRGFKTYYRMDVVNLEYAELCIKHLARFHGLSLAMEIKRPDYFEKKIKNLDCLYLLDDQWYKYIHNMSLFASQFLQSDVRKKVGHLFGDIVEKYSSYMKDPSCIKTICHGDFRANNIMVKEINGKPSEVIAVDYQITHIGNPVLDFIYFIFWGTDQEFRRNHLEHLKELYHRHLGTFLKHFDIDVEDVFPKKEFEKQYKEKLDFGLMIAIFYLPFLFPPENKVPDLSGNEKTMDKFTINVDQKYGERFRGIVDDFIQWGYL